MIASLHQLMQVADGSIHGFALKNNFNINEKLYI